MDAGGTASIQKWRGITLAVRKSSVRWMTTPVVRLCLLLLVGCWSMADATPQFEPRNPCDLLVHVYIERIPNHAPPGLTVRLQDGFGGPEAELKTDGEGMVRFHTVTGLHRLYIYGPGIQEYEGTVDIERVEVRRTENIVVRPKKEESSGAHLSEASPGSGMISVPRLKVPERAQAEFQKGSKAVERKDWREAKRRFEAAIAAYTDYDVAYNGLGVALMASGDTQAAHQAFEKAVRLNDHFGEAYRNLARLSFSEHKYEEADALLTKSLTTDPLNAWALTYAAYCELLTHKFSEAIAHARIAHTVPHERLASVHIVAARALEATQQPAEALAEYRLYLEEEPKGPDAARAREAVARLSNFVPR